MNTHEHEYTWTQQLSVMQKLYTDDSLNGPHPPEHTSKSSTM